MEDNDKVDEKEEKGSNSCVKDFSIDGGGDEKENNDNNEGSNLQLNKSFDDILNFTKKLNLKDNFENILDLGDEDFNDEETEKTRSKTFVIKNLNIKNT